MSNTQDSEDDLFYFETDHLALRGNKDYSEVLKNLVILCAQRKQAIKDYNRAVELKQEALENPSLVLEKIIKGESLGMPDMHNMPELPVIDWSKYDVKIPEETFKLVYSDDPVASRKPEAKKEIKISYGKWTAEEQKRLEELLQIHPPEPVELRRFKKIADALGNRTLKQVTSRVQKYFLKLYKAGLPIPGRIPKSAEKYTRSVLHKHQRHNHYLWRPTTFFPNLCVPVVMNDLDSVPGPSSKVSDEISQPSTSSNYLIQSGYYQESGVLTDKSEEELKLDLLKRVRKVKVRDEDNPNLFRHPGFKCDYCGEEPIVGTRWHCSTCSSDSIDFCTDCVLTQMYSDNCHPLNHNLVSCSERDNVDLSDSESNNGSSSRMNDGSSESSDSDFNAEDDEMSDVPENNKHQNVANCLVNNSAREVKVALTESNLNSPTLDFDCYENELYDPGMGSYIFNEIDSISYDYLHSNLLDKDSE